MKGNSRRIELSLINVFLFVLILSVLPYAHAVSVPNLFLQAESSHLESQFSKPEFKRSRLVQIRDELLGGPGRRDPDNSNKVLTLNLFSDVQLTANFERKVALRNGGYAWIGRVAEFSKGSVIFVVRGDIVVGSIRSARNWYQLRPAQRNLTTIHEMDHSAYQPGENDYITLEKQKSVKRRAVRAAQSNGDGTKAIDVMVVYTPQAVTKAGGEATLNALVDLAFVETNTAYSNSGIDQQIQLVNCYEVDYADSGDFPTDLNKLMNPNDGYMDEVHLWRDENAADIVSLWVGTGNGGYSIWIETPSHSTTEAAFNVMEATSGGWVFAHELGHNMGGHHDWYVNDEVVNFTYNKGYVKPYEGWKTIMAYNNLCTDLQVTCPPILYFSNPNVSYNGEPTGVPEGTSTSCEAGNLSNPDCDADNSKMLNNTSEIIASYRIPNDNSSGLLAFYPFNGNADDKSGNGWHGMVNGASWAPDRFGNQNSAYYFNGIDSYIQVPVNIDPGLWPRLTIVAWAKPETANPVKIVISHDDGGFDRTLGIDSRGGGDGWSCFAGTNAVLGYHPVEQDEWVFLAVSYDQYTESIVLYVNDNKYEGTGKCYSGYDYVYIGASPGFGENFKGVIDDVQIYSRILSHREILNLYHSRKGIPAINFLLLGQ